MTDTIATDIEDAELDTVNPDWDGDDADADRKQPDDDDG